jgi:hypothetical protein
MKRLPIAYHAMSFSLELFILWILNFNWSMGQITFKLVKKTCMSDGKRFRFNDLVSGTNLCH